MIKASTKKERGRHIMMLFKTDPRFDNSALTLNLQTETNTPPVHCAVTLNDPFSVLAGKGISKVPLFSKSRRGW